MKRSITLSGHRTSISLEDEFWSALNEIAAQQETTPTKLIAAIDNERQPNENLSSAIRIFILAHYRAEAEQHT